MGKNKLYGPVLERTLVKRFLGYGVYRYAAEFMSFLSSIVLSRYLGPEEYGLIAMVVIFYGFFSKFTDVGLSDSIVREPHTEQFLRSAHILFIAKGVLVGVAMAIAAYPIALFFDRPALFYVGLVYAVVLVLYAFPKAAIAALRKQERLVLIAKGEFWAVIAHALLGITLAVAGFSYWALVLPHLFTALFYIFYYRRKLRVPLSLRKSEVQQAWQRVKSMIYSFGILNFFQYWEQQADVFFVGKWFGAARLGLYTRAYTLTNLPMNLLMPQINTVLLPVLNNLTLSAVQVRKELTQLVKLLMALSIVPFSLFVLWPYEIAVFLWGEEWRPVGAYLELLSLLLLLQGFMVLSRSLYVVYRKERVLLYYGLITGAVSVVLVIVGAFYSIEIMILLLVGGMLFISFPLSVYLGYYKSFGFTVAQIVDMVAFNYCGALLVLVLTLLQLQEFIIYPVAVLVLVSVARTAAVFLKWRIKEERQV